MSWSGCARPRVSSYTASRAYNQLNMSNVLLLLWAEGAKVAHGQGDLRTQRKRNIITLDRQGWGGPTIDKGLTRHARLAGQEMVMNVSWVGRAFDRKCMSTIRIGAHVESSKRNKTSNFRGQPTPQLKPHCESVSPTKPSPERRPRV